LHSPRLTIKKQLSYLLNPATNLHVRWWSGGDVNLSVQKLWRPNPPPTAIAIKTKLTEISKIVDLILKHKTQGISTSLRQP
jgi:hypothetical protein